MMGATPHLDFDPEAYRTAVALVTAYMGDDADSVEALLADAGRDEACAFVVITYAALHMLAEQSGEDPADTLTALGRTAARFAGGGE